MKTKLATLSALFIIALLAIAITGCGGDGDDNDEVDPLTETTTTDPTTTDPTTTATIAPAEEMVLIPAGQFQMGSRGVDDEQPVHTVSVDAFYMDKYEVTNAQFKAFVDANPEWQKDTINAFFHDGDYLHHWDGNDFPPWKADHPVTYVSWYAAMAYAQWAGKRLPTEAEWEKAARGGLERKQYPGGDIITPDDTNCHRHVGDTTPVGDYPPNGYGLYDMAGNVYEWCIDAYEEDFYERSPAANPIAGGDSVSQLVNNFTTVNPKTSRVLRGGSWSSDAQYARVANRNRDSPAYTDGDDGFRCVRAVTP